MGGGDAGGVLVSPAPVVGFQATAVAVSGRLLEPELIALSSHGGHHLFINRIPPRLPKEDVEKIILSQLRLHPFVLQVSKCSVIPQNSLKNKGYGFITLNGSPSTSDLDAIADSLNNKLQVGCRTLGVRVCTDCHSACYVDEYSCVSSSTSTPPNEPADGDGDFSISHVQPPATDAHPAATCRAAAAAAGGDAPASAADQAPARSNSAPPQQLELLQTAVAVLAKQTSLPAGPAPGPFPGPRRRKPGKQHEQRPNSEHGRYPQYQHHHHIPQQQQQGGHGLQERLGCRSAAKPQGGQGAATSHAAAGRQRRHTGDALSGAAAALVDLSPGTGVAVVQPQECVIAERAQSPAVPSDLAHLPPSPLAPAPSQAPETRQQQQQPEAQQDGECGANTGSPRSVTSYSSVSGSGHGSASNSAPGSVCSGSGSGSGSGRVSGLSAGGWCSREGSAEPRMLMGSTQSAATQTGSSSVATAVSAHAGAPLPNSACRQPPSVQQPQPQRLPRTIPHSRGAGATSPHPPPSASQPPVPALDGPVNQLQTSWQPSGSVARGSRSTAHGSRAALAAAGPHGRAGRGQATAALRVPPPPPASQQPSGWNAAHASAGFGRSAHLAHLHSASAPPSSSWYIHQFHRHQHDQHRRGQQQQQQRQYPPAQGGAFATVCNGGGSGGARDGGPGSAAASGGPAVSGGGASCGGGAGGPAALGGGVVRPRLLQHSPQAAGPDIAPGFHPPGPPPPRPAWADGASGSALDGRGSGAERRGSYPGGPSQSGLPAHLQLPVAHCSQQLQQQLLPPQQSQPQLQQQQPWIAAYPLSHPPNLSAQVLQQVAPAAFQQKQAPQQQQQQQWVGLRFAPQLGQQQQLLQAATPQQQHSASSVAQPVHHRQQQLLQQGRRDGAPEIQQLAQQQQLQQQRREPQQWPQQQPPPLLQRQSQPMPHLQQQPMPPPPQQQQHALFEKNGGGSVAGPRAHPFPPQPLSSGCLPSTSPTPTSTVLSLQLLMGTAGGTSSDVFRAGSSVPLASSLLPGLLGWRAGSLDPEYELLRGQGPEVADSHFLAAAHLGMPFAAAAASGVSARGSAELFLGRGSSDGVQDPGEESADLDSADLDPLDLEPMILQLLENDDDDDASRPGAPATVLQREGADLRNQPHSYGQLQTRGEFQRPQQHFQQQQQMQEQRQQALQRTTGVCQTSLAAAAPPPLLAPPVVLAGCAVAGPKANNHQQRQHQHRQQPQQQQPRKQAGFETGSSRSGAAAAWAMPRSRSDGSNSSRSSAVGAVEATAVAPSAPVPAPPPAAAAVGLVGPTAVLHTAGAGTGGGLAPAPWEGGCPPQHATGPPGERPPSAATVAAAAPVVASGPRWAMGRGPCGPVPGLEPGSVGSLAGADVGAFEGAGTGPGWHRRGGGSRAPASGGGGGGSGGNGAGFRGNRYPGGGRGAGSAGGYGGGRVPGPRGGATGGGSAGTGAAAGAGMAAGYRSNSGRGGGAAGGFEPHGFVSGSLPNANLLAVMQRLNE
ncbi:hypothetical protein PLESTB_000989000 [Pleodorina starrii]|uniref:RRM domain-containing protein n=1 Tax=Pleodorina starrii TaxID=330485 RepID=A0A9W6F4F6_9CHLO|nr:hypothetical protein PLESTM_000551600 [Pleodorina starrii]GLC55455.1 hypothetical protein PLESTB_000989000 [Pleodorina starrii]GLC73847.1 hypothetical protein PLESTF_001427400 [Pleodorina starrii]